MKGAPTLVCDPQGNPVVTYPGWSSYSMAPIGALSTILELCTEGGSARTSERLGRIRWVINGSAARASCSGGYVPRATQPLWAARLRSARVTIAIFVLRFRLHLFRRCMTEGDPHI